MKRFPSPHPATHESETSTARRLQIFVLFQGEEATASALRSAASFVEGLGGEILIVAPQIVPYPLPLDRSCVDSGPVLGQIKRALAKAGITSAVQKVFIAYARSEPDGWRRLLPPHCIVFVGGAKGWPLQRLRSWLRAKSLAKLGHEVLVA